MIKIIVIAPNLYMDIARTLSHEISKLSGYTSSVWTIRHYVEKECKLNGNQYAILIGNPTENRLTKDFLSIINNLNNQEGACYGFNGSKAVIFSDSQHHPVMWAYPFDPLLGIALNAQSQAEHAELNKAKTQHASSLFLKEVFHTWMGLQKR